MCVIVNCDMCCGQYGTSGIRSWNSFWTSKQLIGLYMIVRVLCRLGRVVVLSHGGGAESRRR